MRRSTSRGVPHPARRRTLGAQASDADEDFFAPDVRTPARTFGIFGLWAALIAYVALGAPGKDAASQALDNELLFKLIANPFDPSCPPLFTVLFNYMGIWPAAYAAVLLPGADAQPAPPRRSCSARPRPHVRALAAPRCAATRPAPARARRRRGRQVPREPRRRGLPARRRARPRGVRRDRERRRRRRVARRVRARFDPQLFVHVTTLDFCSLWLLSTARSSRTCAGAAWTRRPRRSSRPCRSSARRPTSSCGTRSRRSDRGGWRDRSTSPFH